MKFLPQGSYKNRFFCAVFSCILIVIIFLSIVLFCRAV